MAKMMVDSNRAMLTRGRNRYILSARKFGKKWEILGNFEKSCKIFDFVFNFLHKLLNYVKKFDPSILAYF
jgi:hypothetical protein